VNVHAIRAIYKFEMARTRRTLMQSIISPVISTSLYFVVFGAAIGSRIQHVEGISYGAFIVPGLIMLSLLGMLARVEIVAIDSLRIDLAVVLIFASSIYYLMLDWKLGLGMLGVSIIFYFAGAALPLTANVILFILGWIFQFIGHSVYEKKQPAFVRNLVHLLVGPLWILKGMVRRS